MILRLTRVGNLEFKYPAALVESPKKTWNISIFLIRPKPEHHPALKEGGNPADVFLTEVGMCVAISPILVLTSIGPELVGRWIEFVFGVYAIRHTR